MGVATEKVPEAPFLNFYRKTSRTRLFGWALFGVNFRPLQKIEAIMGGGRIFDIGSFFARLRYYRRSIRNFNFKIIHVKNFRGANLVEHLESFSNLQLWSLV